MALSAPRNTPKMGNPVLMDLVSVPVKASTTIYQGSLVCIDSTGYAVPGATATTLKAVGRAEETVDNSAGASGALSIQVRRGAFKWANAAADQVGAANLFGTAYVVDDASVAKTDGTSTRSAAGKIVQIDSDGVWVETY